MKAYAIKGSVQVFEMNSSPLNKVAISGGGRCNVMHDPTKSVRDISIGYPRGERELLGPFNKTFGPTETRDWFSKRFEMKTEEDGRGFPVSNRSATVVDALVKEGAMNGVQCIFKMNVRDIELHNISKSSAPKFRVHCSNRDIASRGSLMQFDAHRIIIASDSSKSGFELLRRLGHNIIEAVLSLFSFKIPDSSLTNLAGVSTQAIRVKLLLDKDYVRNRGDMIKRSDIQKFTQSGPLIITHQGISGPAVLKLSAFSARILADLNYEFEIELSWLPECSTNDLSKYLETWTTKNYRGRFFLR